MDGADVGENDHLNGLDSKINDRGFFERILKDFKETLEERDRRHADVTTERNLRLDERFTAQKDATTRESRRLDTVLAGFPDEYARKTEVERLRDTLAITAAALAEKVADSATALSDATDKVIERLEARILALEKFQSKILGAAIFAPFVTGLVVYFITRNG